MVRTKTKRNEPFRPKIRAAGDRRSTAARPLRRPAPLVEIEDPHNPGKMIVVQRLAPGGYDYAGEMFKRRHLSRAQYMAIRRYQHDDVTAQGRDPLQAIDPSRPFVDQSHKDRYGGQTDEQRRAKESKARADRLLVDEMGKRGADLCRRVLLEYKTISASMLERDGKQWYCPDRTYDGPDATPAAAVAGQILEFSPRVERLASRHKLPNGISEPTPTELQRIEGRAAVAAVRRDQRRAINLRNDGLPPEVNGESNVTEAEITTKMVKSAEATAMWRPGQPRIKLGQAAITPEWTAKDYADTRYSKAHIEREGCLLREAVDVLARHYGYSNR